MATTRASQSPVVYGWGDCLNNKLANGIASAETKEKGSGSAVDSMLPPPPPTWTRPKKVTALTSASLSKLSETLVEEEEDSKGNGPIIIHGVACGAHNSAFIAVGGAFGEYGGMFVSGAGLSQHGTSLLCDQPEDNGGKGEKSEKGDGRMPHSPLAGPIVLPRPGPLATQPVTQVSLGNYHAALVTRTGQAYTWGWGSLGQLGHGDGNSKSEPTHVLSLYAVHQVQCGTKFTAAVTLFGELYVFGENEQGQLGLGNTQRQLSPVQCKRLAPFTVTHISCGAAHMTAVSTDSLDRAAAVNAGGFVSGGMSGSSGMIYALDSIGSTGMSDENGSEAPWSTLASFNPSTAMRPCGGVATRVWTWGQASTSGKVETLPREIVSLRGLGIMQVACGEMHSLALSSLGQVFEWKVGEIPVHVGGALQGHIVRDIDCGAYHSLALTASGKLFAWGRSKTGQLGRVDTGDMTKPGLVLFEKKSKGDDTTEGAKAKLGRSQTTAAPTTPAAKATAAPSGSPSKPSAAPPKAPSAAPSAAGKDKPSRSLSSITGSVAPSHPFVARISAGEYHNIAIVERDPRRLLLWKILKKERKYLMRLHIIVDMYMALLARMNEDEGSSPLAEGAPDWQRLLGEWSVVGTPHAITTANSPSHALYKQYHAVAATATQLQAASEPMGTLRGDRGSSTSSPRHRSASSQQLASPGSPLSHSASQSAINTASPRNANAKASGGSANAGASSPIETFRQFVGEADFEQVLHSVFGNIASIYRVHSQFVQELGRVIEESHGLGSDAGAAVDAVLTLWRFRLSFFSLYAFYADQYSVGAYHLFVLSKSFPHFQAALKAVQELALSRFAKPGHAPPDFSLKHLLLEPLRHVALETQLLRQLQDTCIAPSKLRKTLQSITGEDGPKQRPTHKAPAPPVGTSGGGVPPLSRRPSLPTRPAPPAEALPSALSHSQFAWHAPYLYTTSSVVSLDETLSHMSGLLERVCKNFNFVDATEILTATMDERGFPQISGGSVELLVKRLTHHSFTDNEFVNAFLLTYRMFITPIQFLNLLVQRYHNTFPPGLDEREKEAYTKLVRFPIQSRVVQVLLQWVQSPLSNFDWQPNVGRDLDENQKALHAAVTQFCTNVLLNDPEWKPHGLLIQGLLKAAAATQKRAFMVGPGATTSDSVANLPTSPSAMLTSPISPTTLALVADITSVLHFENSVKTMAMTIAHQDFAVLREVAAKDFLNKSWTRDNFAALAPGLHTLTVRFNGLASWAIYETVNLENVKDRTAVIAIFVQLAAHLLELRDYNAFVAIMSGLNNSSATRLKKSYSKLSTKQTHQLEHMSDLASGKENYRILRQLWTIAQPPAVPFLALTLKDLTFIEDGNPDKLEDGSTNFYKYRKMAEVIALCLSTRDIIPTTKPDTIFDAYLKKSIPIATELGDDGLYKLSKKRE
jgi:son of sevenless-like protein